MSRNIRILCEELAAFINVLNITHDCDFPAKVLFIVSSQRPYQLALSDTYVLDIPILDSLGAFLRKHMEELFDTHIGKQVWLFKIGGDEVERWDGMSEWSTRKESFVVAFTLAVEDDNDVKSQ